VVSEHAPRSGEVPAAREENPNPTGERTRAAGERLRI
jgi:hypothetical protein